MAIDGISPAAVVFPLFNFVLRGVRTAYEIASVPAETNNYLKTISHVLADLTLTKQLRREKAELLSTTEQKRVDRIILNTEEAMAGLEVLVERARVDMSVDFDRVGARSRMMWVIRDSNKVGAAMDTLAIASQSLLAEMGMLRGLRCVPEKPSDDYYGKPQNPWTRSGQLRDDDSYGPAPPSYLQATIDAMQERRSWNTRRNSVNRTRSGVTTRINTETPQPSAWNLAPTTPLVDSTTPSASITNVAEYIRHNEEILASLAPRAAAAPRNNFIPAVVVPSTDVFNAAQIFNELEAPLPSQGQTRVQPLSDTPPIAPSIRLAPMHVSHAAQPADLGTSSVEISTRRVLPRIADRSRGSSHGQALTTNPFMREVTTRVPGHSQPIRLQFEQGTYEQDEHSRGTSLSPRIFDETGEPPKIPAVNLRVDALFDGEAEQTDLENPAPNRRQRFQVQRELNTNPGPSEVSRSSGHIVDRNVSKRSSRLAWQVDQHRAEVARLRGERH